MSGKIWIAGAVVVLAAAVFLAGNRQQPEPAPPDHPSGGGVSGKMPRQEPARPAATASVPEPTKDPSLVGSKPTTPPAPVARPSITVPSHHPMREDPAKNEADTIALNIRHFGQRFGGNPTGSNAEIVKTLTGGNATGAKYLTGEILRLNDKGELIDQWATPYFFHQNSADSMDVRSAGPDRKLYTPDDIISK